MDTGIHTQVTVGVATKTGMLTTGTTTTISTPTVGTMATTTVMATKTAGIGITDSGTHITQSSKV